MASPSVNFIVRRPWLRRWMTPLANWYTDAAGYRKLGLRADDLIPEESEAVQLALKRLPPKEAYDRVFRLRRAVQASLAHQLLPKDQQTKASEDTLYLTPIIREIEAQSKERNDLDSMVVRRKN
ncbi:ubiquinol-cytochrome c reductase complex 14 kDa protein [Xylona heveae TC161]|uniref:Cytochrome b-c1 complex subunit 7 n=1 Tax=Xylona heveae (strain CBS 132557 / TC161) TaxID=1328760 RepID=A0A165J390_XYLHT|nr:ubiquinol-cytochrome c reductase complex 14 kDa protein [Xylona heveae TC161]KZF25671.1 ubiquinol-cytochrome c reductase complex 14 kDa protein [Xylona heveae TC161]